MSQDSKTKSERTHGQFPSATIGPSSNGGGIEIDDPHVDVQFSIRHARKLNVDGDLAQAEKAYLALTAKESCREAALDELADLYLRAGNPKSAVSALAALTREWPDSLRYCHRLADLLVALGQGERAIAHYENFLERQPSLATAYFNKALLHKRLAQHSAAMSCYQKAHSLGIADPHDVYSNMGVLYSEMFLPARAISMYERALEIRPDYIPALFNLAGIKEEMGVRQEALDLYRRILRLDSNHYHALARLASASKIKDADDPLVHRLKRAIQDTEEDPLGQEGMYFALGKIFDSLKFFDRAFESYLAANTLGKLRSEPYHPASTERAFEQIVSLFDARWIKRYAIESTATPIFICGMFRTGSTLVEQLLSTHPEFTAGGELDVLPRLIGNRLAPYPEGAAKPSAALLRQTSEDYLAQVQRLFPGANLVTDKRPDNFLHIGLIKALFPKARIIHTRRDASDNALSIYFQQFDRSVAYSTDLDNIAHYREQHDRLMDHWKGCLGNSILTVDYEDLVESTEAVLRKLFMFLDVSWENSLATYEQTDRLVKTASVWQVRDGIYQSSKGRWKNYEPIVSSERGPH